MVRKAAEWSWRLLLILAAIYVVGRLFKKFDEVTVPLALAILLSAFLVPPSISSIAVGFRGRWRSSS